MPLVPISTGGNSAIFCVDCGNDGGFMNASYFVGVKEKAYSCD